MNLKIPVLFPVSEFRDKAVGLADLLPYATDAGESAIVNRDGSFTAFYKMRGPDLGSASPAVRKNHHGLVEKAYSTLGDGWMVTTRLRREKVLTYPLRGEFGSRTTWLIEQERIQAQKHGAARYFNDTSIAFTYVHPDEKDRRAAKFLGGTDLPNADPFQTFLSGLKQIEGIMGSEMRLERLGRRYVMMPDEGEVEVDDRLSYLIAAIHNEVQQVRAIPEGSDVAAYVAAPVRTGNRLRIGDDLVAVITLSDVPQTARTTIMRSIHGIDSACEVVWRWIVRDADQIAPEMKSIRQRWYGSSKSVGQQMGASDSPFIDSSKIDLARDVNEAITNCENGAEAYGYLTFALVLRQRVDRDGGKQAENEAAKLLDADASRAEIILRRANFVPRRERENLFEAWLATMPGMGYAQVRKSINGARPVSYVSPVTSIWTGSLMAPCPYYPKGSTALSYVATEGSAPMAFNLHSGTVGHTLFIGATGGGKSTALAFAISQHDRYPRSRRVIFDLNRSMETIIRGMKDAPWRNDIVHLDFTPDSFIRMAPFANIATERGRQQAESFVAYLLHLRKVENPSIHRKDVYLAIQALSHSKSPPSMTAFVNGPHLKSEVKRALEFYTTGNPGQMIDGTRDEFPNASTICVELEYIMSLDPEVRNPIMICLLDVINKLFDGRPTLFVFDEAWKPLQDDLLAAVIAEKIKTLRKANVAMVFATQGIADLQDHPLGKILMGPDVPTKIFTKNPEALTPAQTDLYRAIGLRDWEIADIAAASTGTYYMVSPDGRRLFSFAMGAVTLAFAGNSDKDNVRDVKRLMAEDDAFYADHGFPPARPWQARWIERAIRGPVGKKWADIWIEGPEQDGHKIFGVPSKETLRDGRLPRLERSAIPA